MTPRSGHFGKKLEPALETSLQKSSRQTIAEGLKPRGWLKVGLHKGVFPLQWLDIALVRKGKAYPALACC